MRASVRGGLARMLAVVACACLVATWAVGEVIDKQEINLRDRQEVARMTQKMKTVCVGRFLIDMPEDARVELAQANIDGFAIQAVEESAEDFQLRVAEREAQLRATPDRLGGARNLESAREVRTDNGLTGKIFLHGRTVSEGTAANGLDLEHYRYEGLAAEALVHRDGISVDMVSDERDLAYIDDLPALVGKLVTNPDNRAPAESGFCVDRAYFRDPLTAEQGEQIMLLATLPSHPDIRIMLILSAGRKPGEQGLLARNEAAEGRLSMAERWRVSRVRAERREIAGLPGEEVVQAIVEENDVRVHSFWWEVNGSADNVLLPHLVFKMNTGQGQGRSVPPTLSEGAALGLWDKITSSIRLRPTGPQLSGPVEIPPIPLGTSACAGEPCPETGWWLCGDAGAGIQVLGGQRQFVRKAELMPQALLLPPRTLWEKLRGLQPSFESRNPTPWKLVDKRARTRLPPGLPLAAPLAPAGSALAAGGAPPEHGACIGSFAATGTPCPASGWWRSEESHALDGTRWFAQGQLLPPATFAVPPGVFGRSANTPKTIQRRGEWRLMRLADTPVTHAAGDLSGPAGAAPPPTAT